MEMKKLSQKTPPIFYHFAQTAKISLLQPSKSHVGRENTTAVFCRRYLAFPMVRYQEEPTHIDEIKA